jgi:hypothetical protein
MSDHEPPPIIRDLARKTADELRLPQLICRRRSCRRKGFCGWVFLKTDLPCCFRNLDEQQQLFFLAHYEDVCRAGTSPASAGSLP